MKKTKYQQRVRRKLGIRKNISGTADKPRVFVFKSGRYNYAGFADDTTKKVLFSKRTGKNVVEAKKLGEELGKKLVELKIENAVFDRSGYRYHGNVAAIAEGIRSAGVKI